MASIKVVLRKKKNKAGLFPLAIRITENRKSSFISTGIYLDSNHWNEAASQVKKSHPNHFKLNRSLAMKIADANDKYLDLEAKGNAISASQIKNNIKNPKAKISFYEYSKNYVKMLEDSHKLAQLSSDKPRINHFNKFTGRTDLLFTEIDEALLHRFTVYLKNGLSLSDTSVRNNMVVLRTLFNRAINEGIVEQKHYPFGKNKFKIKKPNTIKIGLNEKEVLLIESHKLTPGSVRHHTRNVFLFSFYFAGIRVADIVKMKWNRINDGRLIYPMGKNKKIISLPIPKKAQKILDEYVKDKRSDDDYVFPELKMAEINDPEDVYRKIKNATNKFDKNLKKIAEEIGISKKITMHIARHTFGNIAGDRIHPQMLQKLYRHTDLSTTVGYQGNFIHRDADNALNSVLDY